MSGAIIIDSVLFYILAVIAVTSALFVIAAKQPSHSVLALVITMFSISGLFVTLHAYFLAVIQILIYAGAILILFLFVLMLIGIEEPEEKRLRTSRLRFFVGFFIGAAFLGEFLILLAASKQSSGSPAGILGTIEAVGRALFSEHLLAFELVSLILLVGVVGVVNLSKKGVSGP